MQILSVNRIKTLEKYGYNYLREIILRRADYKEYNISEKDFKNLHPNDFFEDLYLLNIMTNSTILSKTGTRSIYTQQSTCGSETLPSESGGDFAASEIESESHKAQPLNVPNWDATDYFFKEDYNDLMGDVDNHGKADFTWSKTFICSSTISAMRRGKWSGG
ncbi:hypothetical protein Tco_0598675 [Tanacetum coccineum]